MKLQTDLNYKSIYDEILKEIEKHNYSVFEGEQDTKTNPIFRYNPLNDEDQKISLISKELLKDDLKGKSSEFEDFDSFKDGDNYLFFELVLNGFKEKYQILKHIEVDILKRKFINEGIFIDFYKNVLIIGVNKRLL